MTSFILAEKDSSILFLIVCDIIGWRIMDDEYTPQSEIEAVVAIFPDLITVIDPGSTIRVCLSDDAEITFSLPEKLVFDKVIFRKQKLFLLKTF